jgi:hypothetical protein
LACSGGKAKLHSIIIRDCDLCSNDLSGVSCIFHPEKPAFSQSEMPVSKESQHCWRRRAPFDSK